MTKTAEKIAQILFATPNSTLKKMSTSELAEHIANGLKPAPKIKLGPPRKDYTREELIAICEAAIVPMEHWYNRDSAGATRQVGDCWALLKAGVPFRIQGDTDHGTIWVEHYDIEGFQYSEMGADYKDTEISYLPTMKRLDERAGGDWY